MVAIGGSLALSFAAGALGVRTDPYLAFNFLLEIEGLMIAGFREVKGLESSVQVKEYAEGGRNGFLHKLPGETRYPNLVLSRGLTDSDALWGWYDDVSRGIIVRKNVTLVLLDPQRLPVMWWDILEALPVKWSGPTFNAMQGSEVAVESVELVHKGIVKPSGNQGLSAARSASQLLK